jgi:predicted nucleotidyltransferase
MNNTSAKTYKELASPHFGEVFASIEKTCRQMHISVYLIGAHARIILLLEQGIQPMRGTGDIDFAVMMPDMATYDSFLSALEKTGFSRAKEPYRVIYDKTNTIVDILPFGQIEEEGTIKFTDRKTELSVVGMEEVLDGAVLVKHESFNVSIPPLVGILILKLISWNEQPNRKKDLDDIYEIIHNYWETIADDFYRNHTDLIDELNEEYFMLEAAARMIGIEMKKIVMKKSRLSTLIQNILQKEIDEEPGSIGLYFLQKGYFENYEHTRRIFTLILKGITE